MVKDSSSPVFEMRNATFTLGGLPVFAQTSWRVARGEHWAVLGSPGSGKSLLLEAISGGLPLCRGELNFGFRVPSGFDHTDFIARVAFENRKVYGHDLTSQSRWTSLGEEEQMEVETFLSYDRIMEVNPYEITTRHNARRQKHKSLLARILKALHIEHLKDRKVLALSHGEQQKLQIAAALLKRPKVLLLDDPFTGMDVKSRRSFKSLLQRLGRQGVCVIATIPHPEDLPSGFNSAILLRNLKVASIGLLKKRPAPKSKPFFPVATTLKNKPALVEMRNVTVRYGNVAILQNFDWTIRKGERWALRGPNGSGKSTLLGLINGDHPQAYANDIRVLGLDSSPGVSLWERKRFIGFASPELHLQIDPHATLFEILASGLFDTPALHHRLTTIQRHTVLQSLLNLGLGAPTARFGSLPLSVQRGLIIARAMIKRPALLLLDEPCQGMNTAQRKHVLNIVNRFAREYPQSAIVYVTHRKEELPSCINKLKKLS